MKITTKKLRTLYNRMYSHLRDYVWSFSTAEKIAELEVIIYTAFPDVDKLQSTFESLRRDIAEAQIQDDEGLQKSVKALGDAIKSLDDIYANLYQVKEALK